MSVSKDRQELYEHFSEFERHAVDFAFDAVRQVLRDKGIKSAYDDRAENLVGAIARYVEDCR